MWTLVDRQTTATLYNVMPAVQGQVTSNSFIKGSINMLVFITTIGLDILTETGLDF